jgi:type II secretory pathway component GspD/PulD (secretin)
VERVVKVPILGDLPLLGMLFQKTDSRDEEVHVAIFISPRIVRSDP